MNSKSQQMKEANANKERLSRVAREVYLRGFARLSKAEEVATSGNGGKGFVLPSYAKEKVT